MSSRFFLTAETGRRNMLQLINLRWIAVAGQLATIAIVRCLLDIRLPVGMMLVAPAVLVVVNILSAVFIRRREGVATAEIFCVLLLDIAALTLQLYLSGGITNPFISLFLLQIVLGTLLLGRRSSWLLACIAATCFSFLTGFYRPLDLPPPWNGRAFDLYLQATPVCFGIVAVLLVIFITRITGNLRKLDARLASLRQMAAEEDLIVRMGLLASGAAHELSTPLSSLAVILGDWRRLPVLADNLALQQEIDEMEAEVRRCKSILTGILQSAGEVRGEAPTATGIRAFLDEVVGDWCAVNPSVTLGYRNNVQMDAPIVSDPVLKKILFNVFDNAAEVSPQRVDFTAERVGAQLVLRVTDSGPGFTAATLAAFGKPYNTSKGQAGGGLGLFLVVNVLRKLGGTASARNLENGGASVTLSLPLDALALDTPLPDGGVA